jgi:hypothetical protein
VGIRLPSRQHDAVVSGSRDHIQSGELRRKLPLRNFDNGNVSRQACASWQLRTQRAGSVRPAWKCLGVVQRLVRRGLLLGFGERGSSRTLERNLSRDPRRQLVQLGLRSAVGLSV